MRERETCSACGAKITWAHFADGVRPIERCDQGAGTVAIQAPLPGVGGRTVAVLLSGIPTSYRLHLDTCASAAVFRNRWRKKLRCRGCGVAMDALVKRRSVCSRCQGLEAMQLVVLAGAVVERFGVVGAHSQIETVLRLTPPPAPASNASAHSVAPQPKARL